jgi:hypothetical protein
MRRQTLIPGLVVVSILTIATTAGAQVQTKPKAPTVPTTSRAYDKLSLGNQKVASALYQAESSVVAAISANGSSPASRPLTLEEIAARRRGGQAWGQIFRDMKAQGLLHERTLGQVVANYLQTADAPPAMVASDSSGGKSSAVEVGSNGSGGAAHGVGKGGK